MAVDEAVKAKIAKVLALLEGAKTEGEAQAASLALQRLLAKSGLTVDEVLAEQSGSDDVVESNCKVGDSSSNWKLALAHVIADNYRCKYYFRINRDGYRTAVFIGAEEDSAVAAGCFHATVKAAQRCFKAYCKQARLENPLVNTKRMAFRNGYYLGFVEGLKKAYAEQVASDASMAIVLQTPAIVKARYNEVMSTGRKARTVKINYMPGDSYDAGQADGYGFGRGDRLTA